MRRIELCSTLDVYRYVVWVTVDPGANAQQSQATWVLRVDAVKDAIAELKHRAIHPHILAYLELRRIAVATGALTGLQPQWSVVGDVMRVDGGPPSRPYFRPFSRTELATDDGYWMNRNLAGSFAPSSYRKNADFMLNGARDGFELTNNHVSEARNRLLAGHPVPEWALAAYYLRNVGFELDEPGDGQDLLDVFDRMYEFTGTNAADAGVLFDRTIPTRPGGWFEEFVQ